MAVSVPYSFAPSTLGKSSEVDANFQALVDALNNDYIPKDGSVAFTNLPAGPAGTAPTTDAQLANRKFVTDNAKGVLASQVIAGNSPDALQSAGWTTILDLTIPTFPKLGTITDGGAVRALKVTAIAQGVAQNHAVFPASMTFRVIDNTAANVINRGSVNAEEAFLNYPSVLFETFIFDNTVFAAGASSVHIKLQAQPASGDSTLRQALIGSASGPVLWVAELV